MRALWPGTVATCRCCRRPARNSSGIPRVCPLAGQRALQFPDILRGGHGSLGAGWLGLQRARKRRAGELECIYNTLCLTPLPALVYGKGAKLPPPFFTQEARHDPDH